MLFCVCACGKNQLKQLLRGSLNLKCKMYPHFIEANDIILMIPQLPKISRSTDFIFQFGRAAHSSVPAYSAPPVPVAYRASHQHAYGRRRQSRLPPPLLAGHFISLSPSIRRSCLFVWRFLSFQVELYGGSGIRIR